MKRSIGSWPIVTPRPHDIRNPIHLPEDKKTIELPVFKIRAKCIERWDWSNWGAVLSACALPPPQCAWLDVGGWTWIPFRFKTLILFFFQTVNIFWIPFEAWCYLEFMQQNKIAYTYILINFIFSKKSTFEVYYCNFWLYTCSIFCTYGFNIFI